MNLAKLLHEAKKGFIIAPAGCGKTHLIAEAVVNYGGERELILTHTHAGVDSIRRKIRSLNPQKQNFNIETIDGFILRYVSHYPNTSGWTGNDHDIDWASVRGSGIRLFKKLFIQKIINISYSGLYVDEYQDCCMEQHAIIMELSQFMAVRILGDHLQGIFNFKENKIIDWERDVSNNFSEIGQLNTPWRWNNAGNPDLGTWVSTVRQAIMNNDAVSLDNLPSSVKRVDGNTPGADVRECKSILSRVNSNECIVIIGVPDQVGRSHGIASKLSGIYGIIEPLDAEDLKKTVKKLSAACIFKRATALLDFGVLCFSGITKSNLEQEYKALKQGHLPNRRKRLVISEPLEGFVNEKNQYRMITLVESFKKFPRSHLYRKELYFGFLKILKESAHTGILLDDALVRVREGTRRRGRGVARRAVGRTVLIKGLEFDHAIILDADLYDSKNLYVALTRASKSMTIISKSNRLLGRPRGVVSKLQPT